VLERLEVVPLSSSRIMFVVSVRAGLVRTIVLEIETELRREDLLQVVDRLNERLAGLTLEEIRLSYADRLRDVQEGDSTGVVRLVLESSEELFSDDPEADRLTTSGAERIIQQPEFRDPEDLRRLINLLDHEEDVVRLLEERGVPLPITSGRTVITIGQEHGEGDARHFSVVTAQYRLGEAEGTVGIVGPTRMDYQRAVALVEAMAGLLDDPGD
jgi:heat-inducible transcriptional repressor